MKGGVAAVVNAESLPNIKGEFSSGKNNNQSGYTGASIAFNSNDSSTIPPSGTGAFRVVMQENAYCESVSAIKGTFCTGLTFDASLFSSTYQDNVKVQPDNVEVIYCIKY